MKRIFILSIIFPLLTTSLFADIAPSPIVIKGIYTTNECKIRMVSEVVKADIYKDSSRVECIFEMLNLGDDINIQIGFPVMAFQYMSRGGYTQYDKTIFEIFVDGRKLSHDHIKAPEEMEPFYRAYMDSFKADSIFSAKFDSIVTTYSMEELMHGQLEGSGLKAEKDSLYVWRSTQPNIWGDHETRNNYYTHIQRGVFPWYVWDESFQKDERKQIKVIYRMPSGIRKGFKYRYFKYLLSTGAGWHDNIGQADVILHLHDIPFKNVEKISPRGYRIDKTANTVKWKFTELEPTPKDDIYLQYFDPTERKAYKKASRKRSRRRNWLNN